MRIKTVLLLLFLLISEFLSAQCAMCKAVIEGGNEDIAEGVNNGITYLMIFPYLLVGFLVYILYKNSKKNKA